MRPKMVVLMGDVVVNEILGDENTVAVVRGKVVDKKGIRYIGTYNPVMILNDDNKKVELWNDLKLLKDEAQKNNIEI
jgi:DNA polymerase